MYGNLVSNKNATKIATKRLSIRHARTAGQPHDLESIITLLFQVK